MAQFDADIKLKVAVENLEASVRKVENAFKKVQDYRVKLKVDGQNELKSLGNSFKRLGRIIQTSGIVTAVAAITGSLQSLNNLPLIGGGLNTSALGQAVSQLGAFSNAAADAAASAPGLAAGIAASTAALIAFAPQIGRAVNDTIKIGKVAAEAGVPLKKLLTIIGAASGAGNLGAFGDAERGVEEYRRRLYELNETVSELGRRQDKLKSNLNNFNSGSATAEKIARKLVDVTARYNEELREQADLLRRVKGLSQTTLEESKGVKSIETRKRRDDFLARQSQEELQVQKALANLDQRRGTLLEQQLGIEREVTAVVRKRTEYQSRSNQTIQLRKGAAAEVQKQVAAMRVLDKSQANTVFNTRLQLALSKQLVPAVTKATEEYNEQVAAQKRLNSLLEQGNRIRQSYKADRDRARRGSGGPGLGENLALGVGFPLLFGGGAGSVLGSAAGSFVGSGFGGQILGGAIGQSIDQYVQSLGELGSALNPATADTDKLVEALGATNSPFADLVSSLNDSGQEAEALALATQKMVDLVGQDGVAALKEFGEDSTRLGNEFAKAMTLMNAGVAELINNVGLFKAIADQLGRANLINQARNSGNADQAARFQEFEAAGTSSFGDATGAAQRRAELMQEIVEAQIQLNAEADREAEIRARLAEFDAAKVREIRATVAEKQIELEIEQLNAAANDQTRIALEQKLAFQRLMTEQQALYNQFATDQITIDVLRLKLAGARLDYEKQIASIKNAADAATARAAKSRSQRRRYRQGSPNPEGNRRPAHQTVRAGDQARHHRRHQARQNQHRAGASRPAQSPQSCRAGTQQRRRAHQSNQA